MTDEDTSKRTTKEQIDCYLSFVQAHLEIKLHKNDPNRPKRIEELWESLASQLNALKGPTRTAAKWKEIMSHWKNQVRSRARKAKAHKLITGGGSALEENIAPMEERALEVLGTIAVDGVLEIPAIDVEQFVLDNSKSDSVPSPGSISISSEDSQKSRKRKATSDEMFEKVIDSMSWREENEKHHRAESLKCFNKFADSINNMATAMLELSKAVLQNGKNM